MNPLSPILAFFPRWILVSLSLLLLGGCTQGGNQPPITGEDKEETRQDEARKPASDPSRVCTVDSFRQPEAPAAKKVDVLFVMDNSESMNRHWQLMANKIDRLIKEFPKGSDLRFAVILGTVEKYSGKLYAAKGVPMVLDGTKLSATQISAYLRKSFSAATEYTDLTGAGEALFYSLYYAAGANAKDIQKQGFFRPDAALQVMLMSDDAEIGFKYPSRQPWNLPPKCNYIHHESVRKSHYLPRGISTETTFRALQRLKGDLPLTTNAFVNITKEDILVDNSMDAECIYDSPGFGYFDLVKKSGGVLYSIHRDRGEGLARTAKLLRTRLALLHDFKLSKPADQVDAATIEAKVDGALRAHTYNPLTSMVSLVDAGKAGSQITIRHCEPESRQEWEITGFSGEAEQFSAALRWQTAEFATAGRLLYGVSPDALSSSIDSAKSTNHSIKVEGLNANTIYYFQAISTDEFGTEKRSEIISLTTKPDWEVSPISGEASRNSAALRWNTSYPTVGKIFWGENSDSLPNSTGETPSSEGHSITINGLRPNSTYYFQAWARDSFGLEKRSAILALRTVADWSIVGFSGEVGRNSANLHWETPEYDTTGQLRFGISPSNLDQVLDAGGLARAHRVEVAGLNSSTTYFFQAVGRDNLGSEKTSEIISLTTAAEWALGPVSVSSSETSFAASFSTIGYPTNGKFLWGLSAESLTEVALAGEGATEHFSEVNGLSPDTMYYLQAVATDNFGVEKRSSVATVRTKAVVPPLPIWAISDLEGTSSSGAISLRWKTSAYATSGEVFYGTQPDVLISSLASAVNKEHQVEANGLTPDTLYYFQVVAKDDRDQEQKSAVIAIRTQAIPLPSWQITNLGGAASRNAVGISWATTEYATIGEVRWGTNPGSLPNVLSETGSATQHNLEVGGLSPNTLYYFQVVARDDRGQEKTSSVLSVKTLPAPVGNWKIQGFDGTTTPNSATLIWQTPGALTKATIQIGLSADDLSFRTVAVAEFKSVHLTTVEGLESNTNYFFKVVAEDEAGGVQESGVISKRTKAGF